MSEWIDTDSQSTRWIRSFAWLPIKTFDAGWIWGRMYNRWQCISGWGFFDDFPYLNKKSRDRRGKTDANISTNN